MKVLFLDVDGVLNAHEYDKRAESCLMKRECVNAFNLVMEKAGPSIVVSSAWRYMMIGKAMTRQGFEYMLRTHGLHVKDAIVGHTRPDSGLEAEHRAADVMAWVEEHKPAKWMAVDDLPLPLPAARFVKTDGDHGLNVAQAKLIIEGLW